MIVLKKSAQKSEFPQKSAQKRKFTQKRYFKKQLKKVNSLIQLLRKELKGYFINYVLQ